MYNDISLALFIRSLNYLNILNTCAILPPRRTGCSTSCGNALESRVVQCLNQNNQVAASADLCTGAKPDAQRTCSSTATCQWQCYGLTADVTTRKDCSNASTWGSCPSRCGVASQTRRVGCFSPYNNNALSESFCAAYTKPAQLQSCNDSDCAFEWVCAAAGLDASVPGVGVACAQNPGWGDCGTTCGSRLQIRSVACMRPNGTLGTATDCGSTTGDIATMQQCTANSGCGWRCYSPDADAAATATNTTDCASEATWGSTCSAQCGPGVRERRVQCVSGADDSVVDEALCLAAPEVHGAKPAAARACSGTTCTYRWFCYAPDADPSTAEQCAADNAWGGCATSCGESNRYRTAVCRDQDGQDALGMCLEAEPETVQPCSSTETCRWGCSPHSNEFADCSLSETWEPCSASCGLGTRDRTVQCRTGFGEGSLALNDTFCAAATAGAKPDAASSCIDTPCPASWFCALEGTEPWAAELCSVATSSWPACTATCGTATLRRQVLCLDVDTRAVRDDCAEAKPADEMTCSSSAACAWQCFPGNNTAAAAVACNENAWTSCSAQCGPGVRTRAVRCSGLTGAAAGTALVDDSFCLPQSQSGGAGTGSARPSDSDVCEGNACSYAFYCHAPSETFAVAHIASYTCGADDNWSACGTTCGAGTQTRVTTCRDQLGREDASRCTDLPTTSRACTGTSSCGWLCRGSTALATDAPLACSSGNSWGACSRACGLGVKSRAVFCGDVANPQSTATIAAALCGAAA